MRPSNMVVKIKNTKVSASTNGALKVTDGNSFSGAVYPGPLKQSVGDIALQKIKKYEEKYLKASSTSVRDVTSVSEDSDVESVPEATPQSDETSHGPNFNAEWLGNIKFANFSDSESALEILSDLSSVKERIAEPKLGDESLVLAKDGCGEEWHLPLTETKVDSESPSVSTYLQGPILPIENLNLDEYDEDECKKVENLSNCSKSSSMGKAEKLSCAQKDISREKISSYSDSFEDVAEKSASEVNTESEGYSVDLSVAINPEPKTRHRSQKGKKPSQAAFKLVNKSTQTAFKNVSKTPLHSFLNPSPSTSVPKEDDYHVEPFLFSNFNVAVNVEGIAQFDMSREVLKQQIALTKHYISCQRSMYQSYCQSVERLSAQYKPVTLKDTEKLIRKHRHSRRSKSTHSERNTGDE